MTPNVLVYLSGPITASATHSVEDNVAAALRVYLDCIRRGIPAFAPQLTAAFPSAFGIDYETWMAYDFAVLDRCTHMLMLDRYRESAGAMREMDYALDRNLPIFYHIDALATVLARKERGL